MCAYYIYKQETAKALFKAGTDVTVVQKNSGTALIEASIYTHTYTYTHTHIHIQIHMYIRIHIIYINRRPP